MKISSGGVGTMATAMSCNAKSMYPYVWAWNAIGDTHSDSVGGAAISLGNGLDFASVSEGIQATRNAAEVYFDFTDALSAAANMSGPLNIADTNAGIYMHCILNLAGASDIKDKTIEEDLDLYWYWRSGASHWIGIPAILKYDMPNGKTVIVYNMTNKDTQHGAGVGGTTHYGSTASSSGITWANAGAHVTAESPLVIEPYMGETIGAGNVFIICGMVLSDRILYDIPLPVKIHMG